MIHVIPARMPNNAYCIEGYQRARTVATQQGFNWADPIPLHTVLEHMGVSDCVFTLGAVCSGQQEAKIILVQYMRFLYHLAVPYSGIDTTRFEVELKAIRKRCEGHDRPEPLRQAHAAVMALRRSEADPVAIFGLRSLGMLASSWPDHLAACHAGIELMNASRHNGNDEGHMQQLLNNKLRELIV